MATTGAACLSGAGALAAALTGLAGADLPAAAFSTILYGTFVTALVAALPAFAGAAGFGAALLACLAGAAFFGAGLPAGLVGFFAAGLDGDLAGLPAGAVFFTAGAGLRATVLLAGFFAAGAFLAGAFFATDLAAGFAAVLPATGLRATDFFTATCLAAGLRAGAAFLEAALLAARALLAATLGLAALASFALPAGFPFCALAAVELRVVFAISLHRFGRGGRVL
nr:hypothetical protein [Frateuria terrea]